MSAEPIPREDLGVSDDELALTFTERHAGELRYVPAWSRWLVWDGFRWRPDDRLRAYDLAREVCRELSHRGRTAAAAEKVRSAATVAAAVRLAQADPRHARPPDVFDRDPFELNTLSGILDLRTGKMRPHDPDAHLTKLTGAFVQDRPTPLWDRFLSEVFPDPEVIPFIQRMAGYLTTGVTREHAFFFAWGTGANGKGVLLNTLTGILGDYAVVSDMATFTVNQGERHPTDLAMLRAARAVFSQETEEGRRWAESRIKALTGGDPVTARFMRGDFFTYKPQFKLLIAGNHKPQLRNVDEAMRRRLHMIPFTETFTADRRDPDLADKLRDEWSGILGWMVRGALAWQAEGLRPPQAVLDATEDYFSSEDSIARWLDDCCIVAPNLTATTADLFGSWKGWTERTGEFTGTQRRFIEALRDRGFGDSRTKRSRGLRGLGLAGEEARSHFGVVP